MHGRSTRVPLYRIGAAVTTRPGERRSAPVIGRRPELERLDADETMLGAQLDQAEARAATQRKTVGEIESRVTAAERRIEAMTARVPLIACDCAVCRSADPRDRRTRPSIRPPFPTLTTTSSALKPRSFASIAWGSEIYTLPTPFGGVWNVGGVTLSHQYISIVVDGMAPRTRSNRTRTPKEKSNG